MWHHIASLTTLICDGHHDDWDDKSQDKFCVCMGVAHPK